MLKTRCLKIDNLQNTWSTLKIIGKLPSKFTNIRSLIIDLDEAYLDALVDIPSEFMANISELGLNDASFGTDPTTFIELCNNLLQKTHRL